MLKNGANPHVRNYGDVTEYDFYDLQLDATCVATLNSLPKSIYFTIDQYTCRCCQQPCTNALIEPWRYTNGVLNGQFKRVVGKGGEGSVLEGLWCGQKAAYKFVPITNQTFLNSVGDGMNELKRRLNESIQYNETQSNFVVPFYAHYRFTSHFK